MFSTDPGRWTFTASGSSGSFNVNAPVYDPAALALYAVDSDGAIYEPDFTVTLATDRSGATVAVASGLTSGDRVIVYRVPNLQQLEPLPASGPLPPKLVGRQLDRAFADLVALYVRERRSIRAPLADDDELAELPTAAQRAGGVVGFDAQGALTVFSAVPLSPTVNVSSFMQSLLLAANAGAVRNTLGFSAWFQTLIGAADADGLVAAIGEEDLRDALDVERANAMAIQGLTWAKNGANTLDVAAGGAMSDDGARYMVYAGGTALAIDTLFAAGGTLDTGAVGDADYFGFLVRNPSTGTIRVLTSISATAPTMPDGYTQKRLCLWFRRSGGALVAVNVYETAGGGVEVAWNTRTTDVSATIGAARSLVALARVPVGLRVQANLSVERNSNGVSLDIYNPDQADVAPAFGGGGGVAGSNTGVSLSMGAQFVDGVTNVAKSQHRVRTDADGKVAMYADSAGVTVKATVISFEWSRR